MFVYNGERNIKIGQYLQKLCSNEKGSSFLTHSVYWSNVFFCPLGYFLITLHKNGLKLKPTLLCEIQQETWEHALFRSQVNMELSEIYSEISIDSHNTVLPSILLGVLLGMAFWPTRQFRPKGLINSLLLFEWNESYVVLVQ